jgi:cell division protein ZipA
MWELRWVLFGLGILLIAGVYLWGRGLLRWPRFRRLKAKAEAEAMEATAVPEAATELKEPEPDASPEPALRDTDRIVTVRFVPKARLSGDQAVLALRSAGLQHGRYGIFHRFADGDHPAAEPLFSVANLTEPGSFPLDNLEELTIPGMSFFMVLPGAGDPVERFDLMVGTARSLAQDLQADLHDEKGSSWSIQRERYVREEIIEYRRSQCYKA